MDVLAADEVEAGEDLQLGEVMVIAEVSGGDEDDAWTAIRWRCSDPRYWVQRGMLSAALDGERNVD